jgi:gas vesicle protein
MKTSLILPIIAGAAAAAALTYLFATEDGAELRGKLSDNLDKGLDNLKEKFPEAGEQLATFKDKLMENISGLTATVGDKFEEVIS